GAEDQAVERLDRPTAVDEPAGEVVEQLGMGRRRAADAEIVRRLDDALPEMVLPDPVHEDARRERIVPISNPLRELPPAAAPFVRRQRLAAQDLEEPPRNFGAQVPGLAPDQHLRVLD